MVKNFIVTTILIFINAAHAGLPPTQTKGANDANFKTTFKFDFPYFNLVHTGTTAQLGILAVSGGGTGLSSYSAGSILVATAPQTISEIPVATSGSILISNGSAPIWGSGTDLFANRALSNLTNTAINASLIPVSTASMSLGNQTNPWNDIVGESISATVQIGLRDSNLLSLMNMFVVSDNEGISGPMLRGPYLGSIASYPRFGIAGRVDGQNNANDTPALVLQTGNKTAGSGSSGKIQLRTGTSVAGSRGEIELIASRVVLNNIKISSMAEPTTASDAATKYYVDTAPISFPRAVSGLVTGDILFASSSTVLDRLAIGSANQVLWVSSSGIPYWANAVSGVNQAISTVSSAYSVLAGDATILANASTSSFTITIPPAASYPTKVLIVRKIDTNSPPKIVSMAGGFTKHLYTPNESYTIQSDGNAWNVLQHETHYAFQPTIISVGAATTAPNAGTYTENRYICERNGKSLNCNISYYGTGAGGTAGSGDYYLRPPTYLSGAATIDTSITGTYTGGTLLIAASTATIGYCFQSNGSTNTYAQPLSVFNSDSFRLANVVNNSFWRSNSNAFNTTIYMSCSLKYPITEWSD